MEHELAHKGFDGASGWGPTWWVVCTCGWKSEHCANWPTAAEALRVHRLHQEHRVLEEAGAIPRRPDLVVFTEMLERAGISFVTDASLTTFEMRDGVPKAKVTVIDVGDLLRVTFGSEGEMRMIEVPQ